jgi:hypothetical protein
VYEYAYINAVSTCRLTKNKISGSISISSIVLSGAVVVPLRVRHNEFRHAHAILKLIM